MKAFLKMLAVGAFFGLAATVSAQANGDGLTTGSVSAPVTTVSYKKDCYNEIECRCDRIKPLTMTADDRQFFYDNCVHNASGGGGHSFDKPDDPKKCGYGHGWKKHKKHWKKDGYHHKKSYKKHKRGGKKYGYDKRHGGKKYGFSKRHGGKKYGYGKRHGGKKHGYDKRRGGKKHGYDKRRGGKKHGYDKKRRNGPPNNVPT